MVGFEGGARVDRLYDLAASDPWALSRLDWSQVDFTEIPASYRRGAADLFLQLEQGEMAAMTAASHLVNLLPGARERTLVATQVADEARHARFFASLVERLDQGVAVRPVLRDILIDATEPVSAERLLLGMHVLIEGLAHSFFVEGARLIDRLDAEGALPGALAGVRVVVCEWMAKLIARDEARHMAFGHHYLRERIREIDGRARDALEQDVTRWAEMVQDAARGSLVFDAVGVDGDGLLRRCVADVNAHLTQLGLSARFPALPLR